jgi:hypothetical protein
MASSLYISSFSVSVHVAMTFNKQKNGINKVKLIGRTYDTAIWNSTMLGRGLSWSIKIEPVLTIGNPMVILLNSVRRIREKNEGV